ncbi:hypothetical protein LguiA_001866 [Lonicera macranthoides]
MAQATAFTFGAIRTAIPPDIRSEVAETLSVISCQLDLLQSRLRLKEEQQEPNVSISDIKKILRKTHKSESKVADKNLFDLISKVHDLISKMLKINFDSCNFNTEVLGLRSQVQDLRFQVPGLKSQIFDLISQVTDLKAEVVDLKFQVHDLRSRNVNITTCCFSAKFFTWRPRILWLQRYKVFFYI